MHHSVDATGVRYYGVEKLEVHSKVYAINYVREAENEIEDSASDDETASLATRKIVVLVIDEVEAGAHDYNGNTEHELAKVFFIELEKIKDSEKEHQWGGGQH